MDDDDFGQVPDSDCDCDDDDKNTSDCDDYDTENQLVPTHPPTRFQLNQNMVQVRRYEKD